MTFLELAFSHPFPLPQSDSLVLMQRARIASATQLVGLVCSMALNRKLDPQRRVQHEPFGCDAVNAAYGQSRQVSAQTISPSLTIQLKRLLTDLAFLGRKDHLASRFAFSRAIAEHRRLQ